VNPAYRRIYRVVRRIPRGRVATYGVVARLAGRPGAARTVGWALSALPDEGDVPWWRVLNAAGRISLGSRAGVGAGAGAASRAGHAAVVQRALLLREGVRFAPTGVVSLARFGWPAEAYEAAAAPAPAPVPSPHTRAASSKRSRRLKGLRT
jgi:methylated-DNA-protein-cysteine methyltransferase related protein